MSHRRPSKRTIARLVLSLSACTGFLFEIGSSAVLAEDATTVWSEQPVFDGQLEFRGVEQLEEQGQPFQRFLFTCAADFQPCRLEARLPALLRVNEFVAETRINSTHAGIRLGVRLVFPNQPDPATGRPLTTWLWGDGSEEAAEWQTLRVATTDTNIEAQLVKVRTELSPIRIDSSDLYIDRCGLLAEFSSDGFNRGNCVMDVEPVRYGPVIRRAEADAPDSENLTEVRETSRLRLERNQVFLDDEPRFLLMMPDHGESLQQLRLLGINTLWAHDQSTGDRLKALSDAGIVIAATPPHPTFDPQDFRRPLSDLLPLEREMPYADLFCLGNRVTPQQMPHLLAWARLVLSADRRRRRPVMAHVIGSEGLASREIHMVGIGLPTVHRNLSFGAGRNRMHHVVRRASQMTLPWTWIHTESPSAMTRWRQAIGRPPLVVEPEQITMQVIAALSAGVRAVAFWKTQPFGDGYLEESETGMAVALSALHIELLEPWLVSAQTQSWIAVDDGRTSASARSRRNASPLQRMVRISPVSRNPAELEIPRRPDASVMKGAEDALIVVAAWDDSSQFVPGHLYAQKAALIATASETSSASQVTATRVIGMSRVDRPGGLAVSLDELDQFGVVLVSSNPAVFAHIGERVHQVRSRAAELQVRMAGLKDDRVRDTCAQIDGLVPQSPPSAAKWLRNASRARRNAEAALENDRYVEADRQARACLRILRAVQNLYWKDAIQHQPTPTASPFTMAFSSLPEHWQMMDTISRSAASDNLLPESVDYRRQSLQQAGWRFPELDGNVFSTQSLPQLDPQDQRPILQLAAWKPQTTQPDLATQPSLLVSLPPIVVQAGDILEIRGQVRQNVHSIRAAEQYPLMIFDHELGPEFAVKPTLEPGWRSFHMYRQAAVSGDFQISLGLNDSAEVHLDLSSLTVRRVGRAEVPTSDSRTAGSRDEGARR